MLCLLIVAHLSFGIIAGLLLGEGRHCIGMLNSAVARHRIISAIQC